MKTLGTVNGEGFTSTIYQRNDGSCFFVGDMDIDVDGAPYWEDDRYGQFDTTLHHLGKPINSDEVPGVVVPTWFPSKVGPIVLGCRARVTNLSNMKAAEAVVFDLGPTKKTGEGSPALARLLGINPRHDGGEDLPVLLYEVFPGQAATVNGITYKLQPS